MNSAHAGSVIQIGGGGSSSLNGLGSFSGSIQYSSASPFSTTGTLTIALTNTSSASNGGFITGLLFNVGGDDTGASASLASGASHPFINCVGGGLAGSPYGSYDAGAALGGSFLGGGSPNPGIAVGQTGVFTFNITAADAGVLTALDFLAGGSFNFNFLVRFRGFEDGGSDMVGAIVVPLPPAMLLGLAGVACVMAARRTHRRSSSD
jgi:hypothetical protein